jgi:predicted ABC-type ATPase
MTTTTTTQTETSTVVFTMGLPAAGKSTVATARYGATHRTIDPDAIKESHPDYDPKNPAALHGWSQEEAERQFAELLAAASGQWVVDGTGTNAEKMVRRIRQCQAAGYTVALVYVRCTMRTSLARNAARTRVVPEHIIRGKARDIATAFEIVAPHADTVEIVDND